MCGQTKQEEVMETKDDYVDRMTKTYDRKTLLSFCRKMGFAAHRMKSDRELAAL